MQKNCFSGIFLAFSAGNICFSKIGLRHILGIVVSHQCAKFHSFLDLPRRSFKLTHIRPFVRPFVRLLPAVLEIGSLVFVDFQHKDAKQQCLKCDVARFSEKNLFRPKMPEICRKSLFLQIFNQTFSLFSLFFSHKSITIKHCSIVNKTDFFSRNF